MKRSKLMFPMIVRRALRLTTPLMRGSDVRDVQLAINLWRKGGRATPTVTVDSQFGPATLHALGAVAWSMGLKATDGRKAVIRLLWHPWLRTLADRRRAKQRAAHPRGLDAMVRIAAKYIGVSERPAGSNRGSPYPSGWERNFGMDGVSWCGCFAGSVVLAAGGHVNSRVAYTPFIEQDARAGQGGFERWTTDRRQVGPGWLVLYNWVGGSLPEHVGIVEALGSDHVQAIEGNTSGTNPSDGGMVARMQRPYHFVLGYAKPRF